MKITSQLQLLYTIAGFLLLFNAAGAIYGGTHLITHPDGSSLQMSLALLQHTPFHDYLIPGMVLLAVNGFFSIVCFGMLLAGNKLRGRYIAAQGILLTGWIVIQILLIRTLNPLHIVMGLTGLMLICSGAGIVTLQNKRDN